MRRMGEWVLHHRRIVMVAWLLIAVAGMGVTSTVNDRLTVDFSLPGQPGTETAAKITQAYGNGGSTVPLLVSITLPEGQTVTGSEDEIGAAFAAHHRRGGPPAGDRRGQHRRRRLPHRRRPHGLRHGVLPVPHEPRHRAAHRGRRHRGQREGSGRLRRRDHRHGRARGRRRVRVATACWSRRCSAASARSRCCSSSSRRCWRSCRSSSRPCPSSRRSCSCCRSPT